MAPHEIINILTKYLDKNPHDQELYSILGSALRESGEPLKASKIHRNILARPKLKKDFAQKMLVELAKDLVESADYKQADRIISDILKKESKNQEALKLLLTVHLKNREYEKAISVSEKLKSMEPKKLSSLYTDSAGDYLAKGDISKAKKMIKKALSHHPENIEAYILMGDIDLQKRDYKNAINNYFAAIDRDPTYTATVLKKVEDAYFQSNSFDELGARLKEELHSKTDNPDILYSLGKFLKKKNLLEKAKEELNRALEFNPTHIEAREELLQILSEERNLDKMDNEINELFTEMKKNMTYFCTNCSNREKHSKWKCPVCGSFNSYEKRIFLY